jgi:hypothetical protein
MIKIFHALNIVKRVHKQAIEQVAIEYNLCEAIVKLLQQCNSKLATHIYQLVASITGKEDSILSLRFAKGGVLSLIKGCFMRRLAEGLDGLIDSMCTNAAFALGKLASSPNPIVIRDIKQTQFL